MEHRPSNKASISFHEFPISQKFRNSYSNRAGTLEIDSSDSMNSEMISQIYAA